jgi:hypothetical protein
MLKFESSKGEERRKLVGGRRNLLEFYFIAITTFLQFQSAKNFQMENNLNNESPH